MDLQGTEKRRSPKNMVEIVFCIDKSHSMKAYIQGLIDNIENFIEGMKKNTYQSEINLRVGFVAYDSNEFIIKSLTDNIEGFKKALKSVTTGGNEFTLPAIDACLDLSWDMNEKWHRVVIVFTDEPISHGKHPDFQKSKLLELTSKITDTSVALFFIITQNAHCREYRDITNNVGGHYQIVENFNNIDYNEFFHEIGRTVSSVTVNLQMVKNDKNVRKDLYEVAGKGVKIIYLEEK